ncbi:MAG: hypothetical protein V4569_06180 [Pseudomonadota bacterium]
MDHLHRVVSRWAVVALLALVSVQAVAADTITYSRFPPNPGVMPGGGWQFGPGSTFANPTPPRAWVNGVYGGLPKAVGTDVVSLLAKGGPMPVTVVGSVGFGAAVGAVGRCVLGMNAACAVGTAAYLAYQQYMRARPPSDVPGSVVPNDGEHFDYDPGQAPAVGDVDCWTMDPYWMTCEATAEAAAIKGRNVVNQSDYSGSIKPQGEPTATGVKTCVDASHCTVQTGTVLIYFPTGEVAGNDLKNNSVARTTTSGSVCPASIDPFDAQYNVPAGSPIGEDGKCPTARYNHQPKTPGQFQGMADAGQLPHIQPDWSSAPWNQAVPDAFNPGNGTAPADITTSGPASQTGTPTVVTTTNPDGSTVTTTTTPSWQYTYNGGSVTYQGSTTTTTNTCTGAGSCSTGPTTTTSSGSGTVQDPLDPCTNNPDRVGCLEHGQDPQEPDLDNEEIPVEVTPQGGWGASDGTCPAKVQTASLGMVDPYGLFCTYMTGIRFAVIGVAWLIGALIFIGRID